MGLLVDLLPFLAIGLLVLIPTRRLFVAGWSSSVLLAYYIFVCALAALVAELRGPARYLVPILVVSYIAPFVTAGAGLARIFARRNTPSPVIRRVEPLVIPPPVGTGRERAGDDADDRSEPDAANEKDRTGAEQVAGQAAGARTKRSASGGEAPPADDDR